MSPGLHRAVVLSIYVGGLASAWGGVLLADNVGIFLHPVEVWVILLTALGLSLFAHRRLNLAFIRRSAGSGRRVSL